jgi:hypothetical protein
MSNIDPRLFENAIAELANRSAAFDPLADLDSRSQSNAARLKAYRAAMAAHLRAMQQQAESQAAAQLHGVQWRGTPYSPPTAPRRSDPDDTNALLRAYAGWRFGDTD